MDLAVAKLHSVKSVVCAERQGRYYALSARRGSFRQGKAGLGSARSSRAGFA